MNHSASVVTCAARQRGAILVTSLLLLLILTVLGIAMMKMTNMQDRMAGNTRDVNLAFQGAEAAVRAGEAQLRGMVAPAGGPVLQPTPDCTVCDAGVLPVTIDDTASFNWNSYGFDVALTSPDSLPIPLDEAPQYKIEHTQFVPEGLDSGVTEANANTGRDVFTITGRSTGASGRTNTVVQSTYARRF